MEQNVKEFSQETRDTRPIKPKPGKEETEAFRYMRTIFENLYSEPDPHRAISEAAYYISFIKLFPAKLKEITEYAKKIVGVKPSSYKHLRDATEFLLEDGLIAQIVTTLDFKYKQESGKKKRAKDFGNELFLPVNPKILLDLNIDKSMFGANEIKDAEKRIELLSQEFEYKFSIMALKDRCKRTIDKEEVSTITLYYSGMWVTYTLADIIKNRKNSIIYTLLSGTRVGEDPQLKYYMKILDQNIQINALFITDDATKIKSMVKSINSPVKKNIQVMKITKQCCKTSRMTIVDSMFALDGRKLLHRGKKEPSYIGTLYLDKKNIDVVKKMFDSTWNNAESLNLQS